MTSVRIGILTPSSNTALERLSADIVRELEGVTVHFSRFRVTEISMTGSSLNQFAFAPIRDAALLLADARVDVIAWSGTAAGWRGFGTDEELVQQIERATGIPACTSVLALNALIEKRQHRRLALVTPYLPEVQNQIVENYRQLGVQCVAERHTGEHVNFEFAQTTPVQIEAMIREVAAFSPECITTFCTNMRAAQLVSRLEAELDIPIYDTVSTAMWMALKLCHVDTRRVTGWGRLFHE